jgi:hypothetical protein
LRAAGRPRLAPWSYAFVGVLVVVAGTAFTTLPRTHLVRMPVPLIVGVGVVGLWLQLRPWRRGKVQLPPAAGPVEPDRWLRRLEGLLVGRFELPPQRAAELVAEARAHLAETASAPQDEFGPVDTYAMNLAEGETRRQRPWWRRPVALTLSSLGTAAIVITWGVGYWIDGHPIIAGVTWLVALWPLAAARRHGRQLRLPHSR